MNIKKINRKIQGGRIHVKAFPGAKLTQLNQSPSSLSKIGALDAKSRLKEMKAQSSE